MVEKKSIAEIILMPLVVSFVDVLGTYVLSSAQQQASQNIRVAELESAQRIGQADRQVAILGVFSDKITSESEAERIMALRLLKTVDSELANDLATVVVKSENESDTVKNIALQVAEEAKARGYWFPVVGSFKKKDEAEIFAKKIQPLSGKFIPEIYYAENNYYGVTLGGYLTRAEVLDRTEYAKNNEIANDAYIWTSRVWGQNLR